MRLHSGRSIHLNVTGVTKEDSKTKSAVFICSVRRTLHTCPLTFPPLLDLAHTSLEADMLSAGQKVLFLQGDEPLGKCALLAINVFEVAYNVSWHPAASQKGGLWHRATEERYPLPYCPCSWRATRSHPLAAAGAPPQQSALKVKPKGAPLRRLQAKAFAQAHMEEHLTLLRMQHFRAVHDRQRQPTSMFSLVVLQLPLKAGTSWYDTNLSCSPLIDKREILEANSSSSYNYSGPKPSQLESPKEECAVYDAIRLMSDGKQKMENSDKTGHHDGPWLFASWEHGRAAA
eukprot:317503-Pelagomonas_calceolata.AAC.2